MHMQDKESGTKKFTDVEKLQIIEEVKSKGLKVTLAKYDLFPGTYYYWKSKLVIYGPEGLKRVLRMFNLSKNWNGKTSN